VKRLATLFLLLCGELLAAGLGVSVVFTEETAERWAQEDGVEL
jgi:hypothetical protein